ncbi:MAG: MFS transporter [Alphaproteobacteria bacterium]|nr:MFS transporter [Alphaproteobacteria bacterium]
MAWPAHRIAILALGLCFVLGLTGRGLLESFVVFLLPLSAGFGWDRADVVSIYSFAVLASGVSGPMVGRMFDRAGPRAVYMLGLGLMGGGLVLAPLATALWQFQLCLGLATGVGAACLGNVPNATLLRRWFGTRLTLAMSLAFSAFGIGILVVVPLAQLLIDWLAWRRALTVLGCGALGLVPLLMLLPWSRLAAGRPDLARSDRAGLPESHSHGLLAAMRHSGFWGLFAVYFFTSVAMFAIVVQVVAYLVAIGFRPIDAAAAWGFSGMLLPVGMVLVGWLDGLIGRRPSVLLSYGVSLLGILLLWLLGHYPSPWLLGGFVACFGGMLGSRGPLLSTIALRLFTGPQAATIFGAITIGTGLGSALGSWAGGLLHDWTGSYDWVMAFAAANVMVAILPFFTVPAIRDQDFRPPPRA